ncbi:sugar:cation symporter [Roseivivax halodurans JCM 10272]|uniref:Sugar:cation symporter n=1 Tax=Roseivivax halodurans JCM 10272 TaxID=1449350 RepID=X7EG88_9RHOB|nr:MFS transporter [Roseivivax halodurans]ETX14907.1 sugar:cation symporter [Roseivivax halodurans JCM 10272]
MSDGPRFPAHAAFGGVLSAAGLPIYIHAPKVYADEYGVSLAAMGTVLFVLRLFDVIQDPLLGRLAEAVRRRQGLAVAIGTLVLAAGMIGLFAIAPPIPAIWWFALTLTLVFSGFSFLTITFYARGVVLAGGLGEGGHVRLARWRETGALTGVCLAAILPSVLQEAGLPAFPIFALVFAAASLAAAWMMRGDWGRSLEVAPAGFRAVLRDATARRLLLIAFANAAPVAVTSSLFLFFVESRLQAPGWEGPLLVLFFLSAALAAPIWGRIALARGERGTLMAAMVLAILSFGGALTLGAGDVALFALICIASGAATGADLTLLPAIFAGRMAKIAPSATGGFALWSFVQKLTLAFAAIALLPLLDALGFESGAENPERALIGLTLLYAALPCGLKLVALAVLAVTPTRDAPRGAAAEPS